jgi:hypothetical protein
MKRFSILLSVCVTLSPLFTLAQGVSSGDVGAKMNEELAACTGRCTVRVPAGTHAYTTEIVIGRPATLTCDSGAVLDYEGTGFAIKLGRDGINVSSYSPDPYIVSGCTFTGGAHMKAGIYVNEFVVESVISENYFHNFGNGKAFNIWFEGQNWDARVRDNYMWADSGRAFTYNGVAQNAADPANKTSGDFGQSQLFMLNNHFQNAATHKDGIGVYVNGVNGQLIDNVIAGFLPNIQLGAFSHQAQIRNITMERPNPGSAPCISFGDSTGPRVGQYIDGVRIADSTCNLHNTDFSTTAHFLAPSTPQSGIQNFRLTNNVVASALDGEPIVVMNDLASQIGNHAELNRIGKSIPYASPVGRMHTKSPKIAPWNGPDEQSGYSK